MRIVLPFFDDSTLIFASKVKEMLRARGFQAGTLMLSEHAERISPRQLQAHLPNGPDNEAHSASLCGATTELADAVLTAKAPLELRQQLADPVYRARRKRPAYVAFQPGLEFTPGRGRKNRAAFDIVFLNNAMHMEKFREAVNPPGWQHVSFGHPYFMRPALVDLSGRRDVYFFAQAICPATLESRRFMLEIMVTLARRHPERDVYIKLRHLPGENTRHAHRERFDYSSFLTEHAARPHNLKLTTRPMSEALASAAFCITCTSTAAMDAISAGIPTLVYVDYPQNYLDPYAEPMRREFAGSDLLAGIPELMELRVRLPRESWLAPRFRGEDFFDELRQAIAAFRSRGAPDERQLPIRSIIPAARPAIW